jgi:hypothetical protein
VKVVQQTLIIISYYLKQRLVCKPGSHQTLYEWVDDFERLGKVENIIVNESKGKKKVKKHDRFVNPVPLRDTDDALFVNWCELTIT